MYTGHCTDKTRNISTILLQVLQYCSCTCFVKNISKIHIGGESPQYQCLYMNGGLRGTDEQDWDGCTREEDSENKE